MSNLGKNKDIEVEHNKSKNMENIMNQENINQKRNSKILDQVLLFITAITVGIFIWILSPLSPLVIPSGFTFFLFLTGVIFLILIPIAIVLFFFSIGKMPSFLIIGAFLLFYYVMIVILRSPFLLTFFALIISTIVLLMVGRAWQGSPEKYTKLFQIFCVAILLSISVVVKVII